MKRLPHLIGITGYARHGKDTIAQVLVKEAGYTRHGFADQVREVALRIDPIIYGSLGRMVHLDEIVRMQGWEAAKAIPEVRRLLIALGTQGVRDVVGEDAWISALAKKFHLYDANALMTVIPDVRFLNEADWIRRMGGEIWRVTRYARSKENGRQVLFNGGVPKNDRSEREIPQIRSDLEFRNDGSVEDLQALVRMYIVGRGFETRLGASLERNKTILGRLGR